MTSILAALAAPAPTPTSIVRVTIKSPASGIDSGIAGLAVTANSIVVAYHLASLQNWLNHVSGIEEEATTLIKETAAGELARVRLKRRAEASIRRYPWVQVTMLLVLSIVLTTMAFLAARHLSGVPWYYIDIPAGTLILVFLFSSASTLAYGVRRIHGITDQLVPDR